MAAKRGACRDVKGFFVGLPNSERSQQDCAKEYENGEHRQDFRFHGKVHEGLPGC